MGGRNSGKASIGGYISKNLKNRLQEIARVERRSISQMVEIFLEEGVKRYSGEDLDSAKLYPPQTSQK